MVIDVIEDKNFYVFEMHKDMKFAVDGLGFKTIEVKSTYNELTDNENFSLKILDSQAMTRLI